jgi:hypothetical protein
MAIFTIQILPQDPNFVPTDAQLHQMHSLLSSYCSWNAHEVKAKRFSKPTLVDSGAAFESFKCPLCSERIDRFDNDEHGEWWAELEDQLELSDYPPSESLAMPCCGAQALFSQFNFGRDASFARWVVSVRDYELHSGAGKLDATQLQSLEAAAGAKLVQIVSVG